MSKRRPSSLTARILLMTSVAALFPSALDAQPRHVPPRRRVVLVTVDAGAAWIVNDLVARGRLARDGAVRRTIREGSWARAMLPPNGAATAPSHAVLFTGALPARTGLVATNFLDAADTLGTLARPFLTPLRAEALWTSARRQGLRVTCVYAPHADASSPDRACTRTLPFPRLEMPGTAFTLAPAAPAVHPRFEHVVQLAPPELRLAAGTPRPSFVYAVDTVRDGRTRYHALLLSAAPLVDAAALRRPLVTARYARVPISEQGDSVSAAIRRIDPTTGAATLYLGAIAARTTGIAPADSAIVATNPPGPDTQSLITGVIDDSIWTAQSRMLEHHGDVAVRRMLGADDWDLLITYLPIIDNFSHRYLTVDPRQGDFMAATQADRRANARAIETAYRDVDRLLADWMRLVPDADFVIVSDHGMVPSHTGILLNVAMSNAGIRLRDEALAYTDGASAHIYVAREGSHPRATLSSARADTVTDRIAAAILALRDPCTGESPIALVARGRQIESLGLAAPGRAGDLYVGAKPGWNLLGATDTLAPVFITTAITPAGVALSAKGDSHVEGVLRRGGLNTTSAGIHSYLADVPQLRPIFYARGPHVPRGELRGVRSVDVAPTVSALLGIAPPRDAEGRSVLRRR